MKTLTLTIILLSLVLPIHTFANDKGEYKKDGWTLPIPITEKAKELITIVDGKIHTIWSFTAVTKVNGQLSVDKLYCREYIIAGHIFMYSIDFDEVDPSNYLLIDKNGDGVFRWKVQYRHLKYLPVDPPKWVFTNVNI